MKNNCLIMILFCISFFVQSQTVIKMKKEGGVSIIPCKVNGLNLEFIFDTGASDVSISMTEATFMLKNGYLSSNDIGVPSKYLDASGNLNEGVIINLREIEIAGLKLFDVKASIVKNNRAPLLLGQTAISKLGNVQIDLNLNTLTILNSNNNFDFSSSRSNDGSSVEQSKVIGSSVKIGSLEIAQYDFPNLMDRKDAQKACFSLGDGWRLPTITELYFMYQNRYGIDHFTLKGVNSMYWSSSKSLYFGVGAGAGQTYSLESSEEVSVRAVRTY